MLIEPGTKFHCDGEPYRARKVYQWKEQWWVPAAKHAESVYRLPRTVIPLSRISGALPPSGNEVKE